MLSEIHMEVDDDDDTLEKCRLQVDRWLANVMSHLTQLEMVKLGVTGHQLLRPNQDAALNMLKKWFSKHCSRAN